MIVLFDWFDLIGIWLLSVGFVGCYFDFDFVFWLLIIVFCFDL